MIMISAPKVVMSSCSGIIGDSPTIQTRMHSGRIRTVRCSSRLPRGRRGVCLGRCLPGGCLPGVSARGGVICPKGCLAVGCLPKGGLHPPGQNS